MPTTKKLHTKIDNKKRAINTSNLIIQNNPDQFRR